MSYQELTEVALQSQRITDGHWELQIAFAVTGTCMEINGGASMPSVVVQVSGATLTRVAGPTKTSVDAGLLFPVEIEA